MAKQGLVTVKVDVNKAVYASLDPGVVATCAKAAIGRTKASAKAEAVRLITSVWNISRSNLERTGNGNERITVTGTVTDDLKAEITFWAGGISLFYFGAKEFRLTAARSKQQAKRMGKAYTKGTKELLGIRVQVQRGGKVALLRQFFATVRAGKSGGTHIGVFRRAPGRYRTGNAKMIESEAVGIATMVRQPKVMQPLTAFIADTFDKRMRHELARKGFM